MKRTFIILFFILALAGILWALQPWSTNQKLPSPSPSSLTPLTLAFDWTPNTNHTGIYVALLKGYYEEEGIKLTALPYSESTSADVLVASHKADLGISSTEGVIADAALGRPVVSIAAIVGTNTSAVITKKGSGLDSPSKLDGTTYGGFGAPYEEAVMAEMIRADGGRGEFETVVLSTSALEALKSEHVDFDWIFYGWDGIAAELDPELELNVFFVNEHGIPDYPTPNIIASQKVLDEKEELIGKFLRATSRGYEFARANPEEAARILIESVDTGTFPDEELVYRSQEWLSPRYAKEGQQWGTQDIEAAKKYAQFMIDKEAVFDATGEPVAELELEGLFTNEYLQ